MLLVSGEGLLHACIPSSMGGCHSLECDTVTKDIWAWALTKNIWLSAAYIRGKTNRVTDKMSREFNATGKWILNSSFFDKVVQCFSRPLSTYLLVESSFLFT